MHKWHCTENGYCLICDEYIYNLSSMLKNHMLNHIKEETNLINFI